MNKQMIAKWMVKAVIGAAVSTAIGYAIKGERALGEKIDEYFTKATTLSE